MLLTTLEQLSSINPSTMTPESLATMFSTINTNFQGMQTLTTAIIPILNAQIRQATDAPTNN